MKKDKWLKWKLGAVLSLGIAVTFYEIKTSSAFAEAVANAGSTDDQVAAGTNNQDPVMDDDTWQSFFKGDHSQDGMSSGAADDTSPNDSMDSGSGFRSRSRIGSDSNSNSGSNSFFNSGSSDQASDPQTRTHTRTGRS